MIKKLKREKKKGKEKAYYPAITWQGQGKFVVLVSRGNGQLRFNIWMIESNLVDIKLSVKYNFLKIVYGNIN